MYRGHNPAGETAISAPTESEPAATVLIVAEDETETVKMELGFQEEIHVFAHSDAIKAIQRITRDRPRLVMLARAFADTSRGAALVHTIKTDHTLANTQIRVISRAGDYGRLLRRTEPNAASEAALPGEALPSDHLGSRAAHRYKLQSDFELRVAGNLATVVELSATGVRVVGSTALRLNQRVRLVMGTAPDVVRCSGQVVWVTFEPRGRSTPRYRAGVQFIDTDPEAIEAFALRHKRQ